MMRKLGIVAICIAAVIAAWWKITYPTYTHRFRLTIEVETPEGIKSGSSVIEVVWQKQPQFPGPNVPPWASQIIGQAPLIDIGSRGILLAALRAVDVANPRSQSADFIPLRAFNKNGAKLPASGFPIEESALKKMSQAQGSIRLLREDLPQLIWLSNADDVSTALPLTPEQFPKVIDPNVQLRGAVVEITTDAVGTGLQQNLPWLKELREQQRVHGTLRQPGQFHVEATYLLGDAPSR